MKLKLYILMGLFGVFFLPFTSLPVMPSDYRPVTVYFLFLSATIVFIKFIVSGLKIERDVFYLLVFFVISSLYSFLFYKINNIEVSRMVSGMLVILVGIIIYVGFKNIIRNVDEKICFDVIAISTVAIACIGTIEVLSSFGVLPQNIKIAINYLLAGKTVDRIQLATSEASWAARSLLFLMPVIYYLYKRTKNIIYMVVLIICSIFFIYAFSLAGFVVLLLSAFIYIFLGIYSNGLSARNIYRSVVIVFILLILSISSVFLGYKLLSGSGGYYIKRLQKFSSYSNVENFVTEQQSIFVRVFYPVIAIKMFIKHPYGVGLDGYGIYFEETLHDMGFSHIKFPEVVDDINTKSADPKNMYAKLLAEQGLLTSWPLILFLLYHIKIAKKYKILNSNSNFAVFLRLSLAVAFASQVQGGSYAYAPFLFSLALNVEIAKKIKNGKHVLGD